MHLMNPSPPPPPPPSINSSSTSPPPSSQQHALTLSEIPLSSQTNFSGPLGPNTHWVEPNRYTPDEPEEFNAFDTQHFESWKEGERMEITGGEIRDGMRGEDARNNNRQNHNNKNKMKKNAGEDMTLRTSTKSRRSICISSVGGDLLDCVDEEEEEGKGKGKKEVCDRGLNPTTNSQPIEPHVFSERSSELSRPEAETREEDTDTTTDATTNAFLKQKEVEEEADAEEEETNFKREQIRYRETRLPISHVNELNLLEEERRVFSQWAREVEKERREAVMRRFAGGRGVDLGLDDEGIDVDVDEMVELEDELFEM